MGTVKFVHRHQVNETGKFEDPKYLFETTEYHYRRPSKTSWTSSSVSLTPNLYENMYDYFRGRRPVTTTVAEGRRLNIYPHRVFDKVR